MPLRRRTKGQVVSYNAASISHPKIGTLQIEISNDKEFLSRIKKANRELRKKGVEDPEKLWRYQRVGGGRIPVEIQRLFGQDVQPENGSANAGSTS